MNWKKLWKKKTGRWIEQIFLSETVIEIKCEAIVFYTWEIFTDSKTIYYELNKSFLKYVNVWLFG